MVLIPEELKKLLEMPGTVKVLGTVDDKGIPHVVLKDSMKLLDDGTFAYAEDLDSSESNKNMVRSIWFDKFVSINISKGEKSYQIIGKPKKCLITGPLFKEFLIRERAGNDSDIQSVWIITPLEVRNQSRIERRKEESSKKPYLNFYLDRLKKAE